MADKKKVRKPRTPPANAIKAEVAGKEVEAAKPATVDEFDFFDAEPSTEIVPAATSAVRPAEDVKPARAARTAPAKAVDPAASEKHSARPVVNMDVRKLTASQDKQLDKWRGNNHGASLDAYFSGLMDVSRIKHGHASVVAATTDENLIVGIPCPFVMEYLFGQDAFPLGLIFQIVGQSGSLKSALLYEIFRLFRNAHGGSFLAEVETKFSPELLRSIVGFGPTEHNVNIDICHSVEEWQERMLYNIKRVKETLTWTDQKKKIPGPGRTIPICFGVDSVSGKLSRETQEKVNEAGSAGRSFPLEALSITGFMKTVPHIISNWPFAIILNNHLKMGKDDMGHDIRNITGGKGLNFQETIELETKIRKSKIVCKDWEGAQISIKCTKNSISSTGRSIDARMLWWFVDGPNGTEQVTRWDWNWSLVSLLRSGNPEIKGMYGQRLKDKGFHLEAPTVSDVENTAWSKNLGMTKEDAKPWTEVGAMISADEKLMDLIRSALGIKRRPFMDGDYLKQLEGLREALP